MRSSIRFLILLLLLPSLCFAQDDAARKAEIKELEAMLSKVDAALKTLDPVVKPAYELRLFDVRALLVRPIDRPAPSLTIPSRSAGYRTASGAPKGKAGAGSLSFEEAESEGSVLEPDKLEELIQNSIGEDRWDDPASIEIHRGALMINQTQAALAQTAKLLATLKARQLQSMQLEVGFYALSPAILNTLQESALKSDGVLSTAALALLDKAVGTKQATLIRSAMLTALNQQRVYLHQGSERAYVSEFVQSSGGTGTSIATVADPIIKTLRSGLALDMRPTLIERKSGRQIALDVRFVQTKLLGSLRRATPWGAIDTPRVSVDSVRTSAKVTPGQGMLVFSAQSSAEEDTKAGKGGVATNLTIVVRPRLVKAP